MHSSRTGTLKKKNKQNRVSFYYEVISHIAKFNRKSANKNEFKEFNKQQIYIENTFSVERITLSNLVEKIRFLLFFDLKNEYQNDIIKKLKEKLSPNIAYKEHDPFYDLIFNDDIIESKNIDKFRSIIDNSSNAEIREFLRQNLFEVNNYLSHSLFIFYDLK